MCGIAAILSEACASSCSSSSAGEDHDTSVMVDDLRVALGRRGPDNLGSKKILLKLKSNGISLLREDSRESMVPSDENFPSIFPCKMHTRKSESKLEGASEGGKKSTFELHFFGATLHLRGTNPSVQPLIDDSGNILVYNGEVFGGLHVDRDKNDGEALLDALKRCEDKKDRHIEDVISSIKGPWALIYWQAKSRTLWFGRDAFGRRSLLVHWPTDNNPQFILSSVSPFMPTKEISDACNDWEELSCGIYSLCMESFSEKFFGISGIQKHQWTNALLNDLIKWERKPVHPRHYVFPDIAHNFSSYDGIPVVNERNFHSAQKLLTCLRESVMRRTTLTMPKTAEEMTSPLALLFSGGLDSMILAALSHQCLGQQYEIDLLNVSFDGHTAPDRISAREGLKELQRIAPSRRWRLVEINSDLSNLESDIKHVMSLIHPAKTYMDLNIGVALWLAAQGFGVVDGELCNSPENPHCYEYKSTARILLVGAGADEQCAGYGRHRTKYRLGGWSALEEEMRLDMRRIWIRNMGRDDRCISDHGKEARFPFLDEDVVCTLLEIPLQEIADLDQPVGLGDKKILREVARLMGLEGAAVLPKRAIQFGSRIARESNKMYFGSNRAANQASAGGAAISRRPR